MSDGVVRGTPMTPAEQAAWHKGKRLYADGVAMAMAEHMGKEPATMAPLLQGVMYGYVSTLLFFAQGRPNGVEGVRDALHALVDLSLGLALEKPGERVQ